MIIGWQCLNVKYCAAILPFAIYLAIIAGVHLSHLRGNMSAKVSIRELSAMRDLDATVALQQAVWQMRGHECTSPHTMKAAIHTGGSVHAAEVGERMIGFCFGMAAKRHGQLWLWSHMTAVLPEFQGEGIGFALKQAQREWALANGYRVMAWTFDPMQSGNANFNFNRLGTTAHYYSVNHYGAMQDGINAGLASDRLEAKWQLDDARVMELAQGARSTASVCQSGDTKLVYVDDAGLLRRVQPAAFNQARYGIEMPPNIATLKQKDIELAKSWQIHLREAMTSLLAAGYYVCEFVRSQGSCWYVMCRDENGSS